MARRSLRFRLNLATALVATVLVGLIAFVVYTAMLSELRLVVDDGLFNRLASVSAQVHAGEVDITGYDRLVQVLDESGNPVWSSPDVPDGAAMVPPEVLAFPDAAIEFQTSEVTGIETPVRMAIGKTTTPAGLTRYVVVGRNLSAIEASSGRLIPSIVAFAAVTIAAAVLLGSLLIRRALRPVDQLARQVESIDVRDRIQLESQAGDDEFSTLATGFNRLLDRLAAVRQREQQFVADISHELRTPLTVIRGEMELALAEADGEQRSGLTYALEEVDRMSDTINRLLDLARAEAGRVSLHPASTDVASLVEQVVAPFTKDRSSHRGQQGADPVDIGVQAACPQVVMIDADVVRQILTNLLSNAVRHATSRVEVAAACVPGSVTFVIADDGPGFPDGFDAASIERFGIVETVTDGNPTTVGRAEHQRASRTGLGLAIVAALCRATNLELAIGRSDFLGGAKVVVVAPSRFAMSKPTDADDHSDTSVETGIETGTETGIEIDTGTRIGTDIGTGAKDNADASVETTSPIDIVPGDA